MKPHIKLRAYGWWLARLGPYFAIGISPADAYRNLELYLRARGKGFV